MEAFMSTHPTRCVPGTVILNAVTGKKYPWKIGSIDELRLWRVMNTTEPWGPHKLYYDSPAQYSGHSKTVPDWDTVDEWTERVRRMFPETAEETAAKMAAETAGVLEDHPEDEYSEYL